MIRCGSHRVDRAAPGVLKSHLAEQPADRERPIYQILPCFGVRSRSFAQLSVGPALADHIDKGYVVKTDDSSLGLTQTATLLAIAYIHAVMIVVSIAVASGVEWNIVVTPTRPQVSQVFVQ